MLSKKDMATAFTMSCPYGKISRIIDNGIGLNSYNQVKIVDKVKQTTACIVNNTKFGNEECSNYMDHTLIQFDFE
jgi:hypothetical protein